LADDRRRVAEGWRQIQDESEGLLRVAIIDCRGRSAHPRGLMQAEVRRCGPLAISAGAPDFAGKAGIYRPGSRPEPPVRIGAGGGTVQR
jgi:hypothetical protein